MRAGQLALALLAAPGLLTSQLPDADAAFRRGDYPLARSAYERVLAGDSLNTRALYRLAVLDGWDGRLARSLARLATLRRLDPRDADFAITHAQTLAWAGKTAASEALYDSVLARFSDRIDAMAGRARVVAWSGDLDRAERLWQEALARHPEDAELLIGLAQTLYWKGQPELAEPYATRARVVAPGDTTVRDIERLIRAALRPEVATTIDGATDSDDNDFVAQDGVLTGPLGRDLRGMVRAGWRRATDLRHHGTSYGAAGAVIAALGKGAVLRAGLGVRRIDSDTPSSTPLTAELGLGIRPGRYTTLSVGYTRTAFDETVSLMRQGLTVDAAELGCDLSPAPGWTVTGSGGGAWLSDGNRRYTASVAVVGRLAPGLQFGPYARVLGYRQAAPGLYFAPNRFSVIEARIVYQWQRSRWSVRADAGVGSQQVSDTSAHQAAWHVGFALSRGWGANNEFALVGAITNSAAATTTSGLRTETFRYRTLGLRFRQGL